MADAKSLADRIEARLDANISKVQRGKTTAVIIYAVIMVIVVGYFSFIKKFLTEMIDPEWVSLRVSQTAIDRMPEIRKGISDQINANAEKHINEMIDHGLKQIPAIRKEAEKTAMAESRKLLNELGIMLSGKISEAIANHGDDIKLLLSEMDTEEGMQSVANSMYDTLTAPLYENKVHKDIEDFGHALVNLNVKMEYLLENKDLSRSEKIERDILVSLREFSIRSK